MTDEPDASGLWTIAEVADYLRLQPETVRRWVRAGKLRAVTLGSRRAGLRIYPSDFEAFMDERQLVWHEP